jgi:hypothetical protein
VEHFETLVGEVEARTVNDLADAACRQIESGGRVQFGAMSVSRRDGVVGGTVLVKGTIPLAEVEAVGLGAITGAAGGVMLTVQGRGNRRVGVMVQKIANVHVLVAVLQRLGGAVKPGAPGAAPGLSPAPAVPTRVPTRAPGPSLANQIQAVGGGLAAMGVVMLLRSPRVPHDRKLAFGLLVLVPSVVGVALLFWGWLLSRNE